MDREKCRELRVAMQEALKAVNASFGVQITVGNASFTPNNAVFKVEAAELVNGNAVTKEKESFLRMATWYGLAKEDLGKTFTFQGRTYKVSGMGKRGKYPILADREDGKTFKFAASDVRRWLGYKPPEDPFAPKGNQLAPFPVTFAKEEGKDGKES